MFNSKAFNKSIYFPKFTVLLDRGNIIMEAIHIQATEESPEVVMDAEKGIFMISGKSYMEDVQAFFDDVLDWLKSYAKQPSATTEFIFELEYLNTASSKIVLDIFEILQKIKNEGAEVKVRWNYYEEDEDMKDLGEELNDMFELPVTISEIYYDQPRNFFPMD
jgi:NTP pyrophosphatase (non-canonical NTP hydrolase)